jgi:hypothetical protein
VPLVDNSLVDGSRSFQVLLTNASPGLEICDITGHVVPTGAFPCFLHRDNVGAIRDNEMPPTLQDPSFVALTRFYRGRWG